MRLALFVPCYVDQLKPETAIASLKVLESVGFRPEFPLDQVCCGQPFLTAGERGRAKALGHRFIEVFGAFDAIIAPSGSCVATLRNQLTKLVPDDPRAAGVAERCFELCEFLVAREAWPSTGRGFAHAVGLHASCHALRELRLGSASELRDEGALDPARQLLDRIPDLKCVELDRADECCGFGGVFSVEEADVSSRMGQDRLADHQRGGADVLTSTDVSCLLHLDGLARRNANPLRVMHIAEILAASLGDPQPGGDARGPC